MRASLFGNSLLSPKTSVLSPRTSRATALSGGGPVEVTSRSSSEIFNREYFPTNLGTVLKLVTVLEKTF
jgi:hypothetical protein